MREFDSVELLLSGVLSGEYLSLERVPHRLFHLKLFGGGVVQLRDRRRRRVVWGGDVEGENDVLTHLKEVCRGRFEIIRRSTRDPVAVLFGGPVVVDLPLHVRTGKVLRWVPSIWESDATELVFGDLPKTHILEHGRTVSYVVLWGTTEHATCRLLGSLGGGF